MKATLLLLSLLCLQIVTTAQDKALKLPRAARIMLDKRFHSWRFVGPSEEVRQYFESNMKGAPTYLISGDFDGDGRLDYAVLIWHGVERNGDGKVIVPRSYLVAFLRRGKGYRMFVMKGPNGDYLCLGRKGTKDYNYDGQREITYANDAIETCIFEKGGSSYVFEKGRFRSFVSSD